MERWEGNSTPERLKSPWRCCSPMDGSRDPACSDRRSWSRNRMGGSDRPNRCHLRRDKVERSRRGESVAASLAVSCSCGLRERVEANEAETSALLSARQRCAPLRGILLASGTSCHRSTQAEHRVFPPLTLTLWRLLLMVKDVGRAFGRSKIRPPIEERWFGRSLAELGQKAETRIGCPR